MLKNFIMKYVVDYEKIKSTPKEKLQNEVLMTLTVLIVPFLIIAYSIVVYMYDEYFALQEANIADKCRVVYLFPNNDGTYSYGCESEKHDDTVLLLHHGESNILDENPYIHRPVTIYKDGRIR